MKCKHVPSNHTMNNNLHKWLMICYYKSTCLVKESLAKLLSLEITNGSSLMLNTYSRYFSNYYYAMANCYYISCYQIIHSCLHHLFGVRESYLILKQGFCFTCVFPAHLCIHY